MGAEPTVDDLLAMLVQARAKESKDEPDWTHKYALARAMPLLRKAAVSFAEAKDRNEARRVYQLASAALGIDHE